MIKFINPGLDKILNWIKNKTDKRVLKACVLLVIGFLVFDGIVTSVALKSFYAKIVNDFDLDIKSGEYSSFTVENDLFSEENMLLVYPNIQIAGTKYNNIYVRKSL